MIIIIMLPKTKLAVIHGNTTERERERETGELFAALQ
jgi:hypothetical protein